MPTLIAKSNKLNITAKKETTESAGGKTLAFFLLSWLAQDVLERQNAIIVAPAQIIWSNMDLVALRKHCEEHGLTKRQTEIVVAVKNGIVGERQIDYILNQGFDYSGSTQDREYKEIKRKLGIDNLKNK